MSVDKPKGRGRRPQHRLARSLAAALLIALLISAPAVTTMERPASYSVTVER